MSRLRHDPESYLAMLKMTRSQLIVYIEGKENDPVFYSEIAERFSAMHHTEIVVWRASELPGAADPTNGGSGGKYWMIKTAGLLMDQLTKTNRVIQARMLFALDKDLDDISSEKETDPHFVYTQGCTVENYFLQEVDLRNATERALSLLPNDLSLIFANSQLNWIRDCATLWKDWIGFCIVALVYKHDSKIHSYSSKSRFNKPARATCQPALLEEEFEALRRSADVPLSEFEAVRLQVCTFVDREIAAGREHSIMKGEWFIDILMSQIEGHPALQQKIVQAGKPGIWAALRSFLSIGTETYNYYEQAFLTAISLPI